MSLISGCDSSDNLYTCEDEAEDLPKRVCGCPQSQHSFICFYNRQTMRNIIGRHIKKIRKEQRLTQEQLAIRIEIAGWQINRFVVSKIERGDRELSDVEAQTIAKALKVSVSKLFGEE